MIQFDSFKRKIEYRSYAIQNSWRQQPGANNVSSSIAENLDGRKMLLEQNLAEAAAAKDLYEYEQQIYSNRRIIGRFLVFTKKVVRKLLVWTLGWYFIPLLRHQSFVNAKLLNSVSLEREIRNNTTVDSLQNTVNELKEQIASLKSENNYLTERLNRMENTPSNIDDFYHDFEERFRGTREEIIERLNQYVPTVKKHIRDFESSRFVDLGSGRGEWLDIIRANGAHDYIGVDLNDIQNNICRQIGHNVVCDDCINYLSALEDSSIDMISGFQLIEHLYISDIISLLEQCKRVLKKGGIILFETTNPQNILVGANTFYIDPSHHRPLNSELMDFIARWMGFVDVQIIPANAHERCERLECDTDNEFLVELTQQFNDVKWSLYGPRDYALFAVKG